MLRKLRRFTVHWHGTETFMVKKALLGQVGDAEIRLLKIFKAVVESGGLTAAELELNIGRSTVSRHVKDLEERLELVLCRRGRGGFELTPDGHRVYEGALRLLGSMEAFRADVRDLHAGLAGNLALGVFDKTVTNPQARIAQAVRAFRSAAPQVTLDITVGTLTSVEAAVIDGRIAIGIVPDHRRSESLVYQALFDEPMSLYCGREHPLFGTGGGAIALPELQEHDYAGLAFHSPNMEAAERFGLRRRASVSDQEAVALLVLSGGYIGFLPEHYAQAFVAEGAMRRIAWPQFTYEVQFVAIARRSPPATRIAQAFWNALVHAHEAAEREKRP
jgi:LysR family transcriptional regulator, transcriptional activator for bauABCD operon